MGSSSSALHLAQSTPSSQRRGHNLSNAPSDHAPPRPVQQQASLGQYEEAVVSPTGSADQYAKSRHQARREDEPEISRGQRRRSRSRARGDANYEAEKSSASARTRSSSSRRTAKSDGRVERGERSSQKGRSLSRQRNERERANSQVRLDDRRTRDLSVGRNERAEVDNRGKDKSPSKVRGRSNSKGEAHQSRNTSASGRAKRLQEEEVKPLKSPKPTRDDLERKVRQNKQKVNLEKLLNKEKARLKKKFSDGDSSSVSVVKTNNM